MSEKYPKDEFGIREGMIEGLYSVMIVNQALKNYEFKNDFSWQLWIDIDIANADESGLPKRKEAKILNNIEDEIYEKLKEVCDVQYIGRITWNYSRELFFYLDNPETANQVLQAYIADSPKREFQYEITEDIEWANVNFFYDYE